jgi:hypothetical protein
MNYTEQERFAALRVAEQMCKIAKYSLQNLVIGDRKFNYYRKLLRYWQAQYEVHLLKCGK